MAQDKTETRRRKKAGDESRISAYESFRERLFSGDLKPGQFVTQRELAQLAGVSLGNAREAIQRLEHDSLLRVHPQRGIQVADITTRFIREAFQLRTMVELASIPDYCRDYRELARATLMDTQAVLAKAKTNPSPEVLSEAVDVDWRFHDELVQAMNNQLIDEIYQINTVRLRLIRTTIRLTADRVFGALGEHLDILEACSAGDISAASEMLSAHLSVSARRAVEGI